MPPVVRIADTSATATLASSVTTPTYTRESLTSGIYVAAAYNSDITGSATSVTYGADSLGLIERKASGATNATIEIWGASGSQLTETSATCTVTYPIGSLYSIIVGLIEVRYPTGKNLPNVNNNDASGTTSPATCSITTADTDEGRQGTITSPASDHLLLGACVMYSGASGATLSITSGTTILQTTAGAGLTHITMGFAYKQATGASDTISWDISVDREWGEAMIEIAGQVADGMILREMSVGQKLY